MSVLGTPSGNLFSEVIYNSYGRDQYLSGQYVDVNINYYGWVKSDIIISYTSDGKPVRATIVIARVDIGRGVGTFSWNNITNSNATTAVYYRIGLPDGSETLQQVTQYGFGQLIFAFQTTNTIKSIRISSFASATASTSSSDFGVYMATSASLDKENFIGYCTSPNVIVNSLPQSALEDNRCKHIYLPLDIEAGYTMRIKNVNKELVYVHAGPNSIEDGTHNRIFVSTRVGSTSGSECGFIMTGNAACTLTYNGSTWLIVEYYSGQRSDYFNIVGALTPTSPSTMDNPVLIADITAGAKFVVLPSPSGPHRQITLIAYGSVSNWLFFTVGASSGAKIDGLSYSNYNWWKLRTDNPNGKNSAVTLISNGIDWFVMSVTDGAYLYYDTTDEAAATVPNSIVTVSSNERVGITPAIVPLSGGAVRYMKHSGTTTRYMGFTIVCRDGVKLGGPTPYIRTYVGAQRTRGAASVLTTYIGTTPVAFLLSYFVGI